MTVYVDTLSPRFTANIMACVMVAESTEELHEMAEKIGAGESMRRYAPLCSAVVLHFDLEEGHRDKAIANGAIELDKVGLSDLISRLTEEGK